jgi:hypothetical protein
MNRFCIVVVTLSFLAACASEPPPPLTADNPASPSAPEATSRPLRYALMPDDLTKKTRKMLAQADEPQEEPSPTPAQGENQMPQMPGIKMP